MQTEFFIDSDLQSVADFMQAHLPTSKLVSVADHLPKIARLLWGEFPQEPCQPLALIPTKRGLANQSQSVSSGSNLEHRCAGGDSEVEVGAL
jgi:hypothetical protein